jgi:hypothetical protein
MKSPSSSRIAAFVETLHDLEEVLRHSGTIESRSLRRNTVHALLFGLGATLMLGLLAHSARKARADLLAHRNWKEMDVKLDEALAETTDASDPIAKY